MADKIKGITVQIGGDTAPLSKALREVDKEVRSTQANLKEVNKLLKLDPKNTNLLKEKQKLLADQIGKTKEKLTALKKAQEEAAKMLANGEIGQKEYDELGKQIEQCEKSLQNLEKEAAETSKKTKLNAEKIGTAFKNAGEKIEEAGKKLAPFSAAAAAGLGVAVKQTADFDAEMSKVAAISGAVGEDFDALRTKAREMGETTKFSASESAEAMEYMAMAGWKTGDMLDGIEGLMNLAAASGSDLATTSDIVTDALTAMGYSSKESGRLADVMAAASSNANTNVQLMGETFKNAASVAGSYGYTMEDIALATGLMANSGIKGSEAGTALRSIMSRLATDAGASSKKLGALGTLTNKLGVAFYNADGTMRPFRDVIKDTRKAWGKLNQEEQANYANTIAGKNAMSGWLALMNSADDDFNKLADAIDNSNGTAKQMADVMQDNLSGQLTILKSQLSELAISIGDTMMPTLRKAVSLVQEGVDWLNSLDESTKETIATVALGVAALSPVLIIGGKIVKGIGTTITAVSKLNGLMNGTLGPLALVAAGIGTVVAITKAYHDSLEETRKEHAKLTFSQQTLKDSVDKEAEAWEGLTEARKDAYSNIDAQAKKEKELWEQLEKVVDEEGKVKKGKEEEAKVLIEQLNEALGTELEIVKGEVKGYKDLKDSIVDVIEKKKAEALLAADTENWTKAYQNYEQQALKVAQAEKQVADQEKKIAEQQEKVNAKQRELNQARADGNDETGAMAATINKLTKELETEKFALEGDKENLEELKKTQQTAQKTLDGYTATLANHDKLQKAIVTGSTQDMINAEKELVHGFIDAEHGTKDSLARQTREFLSQYSEMRDIVMTTGNQIARDQSYNMGNMVSKSIAELKKLDPAMAAELQKELNTINAKSKAFYNGGQSNGSNYTSGVKNGLSPVQGVMKDKLNQTSQASQWGNDMAKAYSSGITKGLPSVTKAATSIANKVHAMLHFSEPDEGPLKDFHTYGPDMMNLLAQGINQGSWEVLNAVQGVAGNIKAALSGTTVTAQLDQKSIPLGAGVTLNIANFNNYSDSDIRELTNEIMETAASFAARKGAVFA